MKVANEAKNLWPLFIWIFLTSKDINNEYTIYSITSTEIYLADMEVFVDRSDHIKDNISDIKINIDYPEPFDVG